MHVPGSGLGEYRTRLDILLTRSARSVNFLKWGFRQLISALAIKMKRNFCKIWEMITFPLINKVVCLHFLGSVADSMPDGR